MNRSHISSTFEYGVVRSLFGDALRPLGEYECDEDRNEGSGDEGPRDLVEGKDERLKRGHFARSPRLEEERVDEHFGHVINVLESVSANIKSAFDKPYRVPIVHVAALPDPEVVLAGSNLKTKVS